MQYLISQAEYDELIGTKNKSIQDADILQIFKTKDKVMMNVSPGGKHMTFHLSDVVIEMLYKASKGAQS